MLRITQRLQFSMLKNKRDYARATEMEDADEILFPDRIKF